MSASYSDLGGEEWQYKDEAAVNATANAWYRIEAAADLLKIAYFDVGYQPGHHAGHPPRCRATESKMQRPQQREEERP